MSIDEMVEIVIILNTNGTIVSGSNKGTIYNDALIENIRSRALYEESIGNTVTVLLFANYFVKRDLTGSLQTKTTLYHISLHMKDMNLPISGIITPCSPYAERRVEGMYHAHRFGFYALEKIIPIEEECVNGMVLPFDQIKSLSSEEDYYMNHDDYYLQDVRQEYQTWNSTDPNGDYTKEDMMRHIIWYYGHGQDVVYELYENREEVLSMATMLSDSIRINNHRIVYGEEIIYEEYNDKGKKRKCIIS